MICNAMIGMRMRIYKVIVLNRVHFWSVCNGIYTLDPFFDKITPPPPFSSRCVTASHWVTRRWVQFKFIWGTIQSHLRDMQKLIYSHTLNTDDIKFNHILTLTFEWRVSYKWHWNNIWTTNFPELWTSCLLIHLALEHREIGSMECFWQFPMAALYGICNLVV